MLTLKSTLLSYRRCNIGVASEALIGGFSTMRYGLEDERCREGNVTMRRHIRNIHGHRNRNKMLENRKTKDQI